MDEAIFTNRLEELRREKGVSQAEVAKAVNVSRRTMERYESGEALPRIDTAYRLALYHQKTVYDVFQMKDGNNGILQNTADSHPGGTPDKAHKEEHDG